MKTLVIFLAIMACAAAGRPHKVRVMGGTNAAYGSAPYMASVRSPEGHYCGGVILNRCWILTTATCTAPKISAVAVGLTSLDEGGDVYDVAKVIRHPQFDRAGITNDIALLNLRTPIKFSAYAQPIHISTKDVGTGELGRITGWGYTSMGGKEKPKNELQELYQTTMEYEECSGKIFRELNDKQICAYKDEKTGLCTGDAGGPLVIDDELVAIASYGRQCGQGYPEVYVKAKSYLSWICKEMMRKS